MSDRVLLATRKGVFELRRNGGWKVSQSSFLGDNATIAAHDPRTGHLYTAIMHGHFGVKLHRSQDDGKSWTECAAPTYPPKPEGLDEVEPMRKKPIPWNTELLWCIQPGAASQPGRLWAGTIPGGLFRSDDGGDSWELVRSLWDRKERPGWFGGGYDFPGIHSVCVDPRDPKRVVAGVSVGGVWESRDDGQTWDVCCKGMRADYMPPEQQYDPLVQDPHLVVQCPGDPDWFWAQHHNGVFKSSDNSKNWESVDAMQPSGFGFAVAVHPRDGKTAWFAPAIKDEKRIPVDGKFVVTRTRDGGKSVEVLRKGLPQEHAYDLIFRHALAVDESGDRLVMGSTTGSVWISEDQGDSWQHVTGHLPPVHSVQFC